MSRSSVSSASRLSASGRSTVHIDPSDVRVRLCLGSTVVPVETFPSDEEPKVQYVNLGGKATKPWFTKALGVRGELPKDNVLEQLLAGIRAARGKRNRVFTKVDTEGKPMQDHIVLDIRGYKIGVRNTCVSLLVEATEENLKWLVAEVNRDLQGGAQNSEESESLEKTEDRDDSEPLEDPEDENDKQLIKRLLAEKPSKSVHFAPSMNAYIVKAKTASTTSTPKKTLFTIRHKAKARSWSEYREEVEWQRHRAMEFARTGEVLENRPLEEDDAEMKGKRRRG